MMYLVDTSVWIDYFRMRENAASEKLIFILDKKIPFAIAPYIFQEVLQGAANEKEFEQLALYFKTQRFVYAENPIESYKAAAKLYFSCRRQGLTIRSTMDCLIAQLAIENNLILLHNDNDFYSIKKINPKLETYPFLD